MNDSKKFRHDVSQYERPLSKHRCGRARLWQKPCHQGPNFKGLCGGTSECTPFHKGDRFECRRPLKAGGSCTEGPLPCGGCSHNHPPCQPSLSLRFWRKRFSFLLMGLVLVLIIMFANFLSHDTERLSSLNPGELHGSHANFVAMKIGCTSCHTAHDKSTWQWLQAAFISKDMSDDCLTCHTFEGKEKLPHNRSFSDREDMKEQKCTSCHTEHKGDKADISQLSNAQCGSSCHQEKFKSFAEHKAFSDNFPHKQAGHIRYNHNTHGNKYFTKPKYVKRAPDFAKKALADCTTCHKVNSSNREVKPGSFDEVCASCHEKQIRERKMVMFQLPEIEKPFNQEEVNAVCDPSQEDYQRLKSQLAALTKGNASNTTSQPNYDYESLSSEEIHPILTLLSNQTISKENKEGLRNLLMSMASNGAESFVQLLEEQELPVKASDLFAGLSTELVQKIACHWMSNEEYSTDEESSLPGWVAGEDGMSISYQPTGHNDAVLRQWINFAFRAKSSEEQKELGDAVMSNLMHEKKGAGACGKCHIAANTEEELHWGLKIKHDTPYTTYSHGPHIDVLGSKGSCKTCHVLDKKVDYSAFFKSQGKQPYISNFKSIKNKTCSECHASGKINDDCQLCHVYHTKGGFKKSLGFDK